MHWLIFILLLFFSYNLHAFQDLTTGIDASHYQQRIRNSYPQPPRDAAAALTEAERHARQKRWRAAIDGYEAVIAAGQNNTSVWLALSRAWQNLEQHHPQQGERVLQAAYTAYEVAQTPAEKAQALFRLGDLYGERNQLQQALAAFKEGLTFKQDPEIKKRYEQLVEAERFQVKGVDVVSNSAMPKICLLFSSPLKKDHQIRYEDFLRIEPTLKAEVSAQGRRLCIAGVSHGQRYAITVRPGLPAASGEKIAQAETFTSRVGDRQPSLGFRGNTYVLPRNSTQNLPLTSVNVTTARLQLLRIDDRNLTQQINQNHITATLSGHDIDRLADQAGELVWQGELAIDAKPNREITTAIPVEELLQNTQPGIYVITAAPADDSSAPHDNRATQWLVVSDLGLSTFTGADGLHVFVRSLASAQPLAGVKLHLYARSNRRLGVAVTDRSGYARFDPGLLRGAGGSAAAALMAYGDNDDFNFLDLTQPGFDLSDRGVAGREAPGPIDAFVYTERGVYRPGETVELMALLRDNRGYAVDDLPLILTLIRPDEVEAARRVLSEDHGSGYHVSLPIAANARTGTWSVRAYTDPKAEPVGRASFQVEDFVPQRLELDLTTTAEQLEPGAATTLTVQGRYLYGTPAADLNAEAELVLAENPDPYPAYPGYRFGLVQERWDPKRYPLAITGTDGAGKADTTLRLDTRPDTTRALQAQVQVSLFEPGGRPVSRSLSLPYRHQPFAIGIRPRFKGDGIDIGQQATFDIIALDATGEPRALSGLQVEFYRENYEYYWYFQNNRWDYRLITRDSDAVASQSLDLQSVEPGEVVMAGQDWGSYRLEVFDLKTGVASSVRFQVGWFARPGGGDSPDQLQITLDKPRYRPGDTARVHVRAPFAGEVLLTLASDKLWSARTFSLPEQGGILELPVDEQWTPGIYLTATAFRPADAQPGPGRAIGVTWLGLDVSPRSLEIELDTPAELQPRQQVELPVRVSGGEPGKPVWLTLAAVDEGILQLTDFSSPDPVGYFLGKRRLGVELLDLYGKLIEAGGRPGKLRVGGGSDSARQRESLAVHTVETVSLFSGPVALDDQGRASIPLNLPDFNGQLRLMAVAWDQDRLGQAEAELLVRDPLVTQVYLPRFLAPGDTSQVALTLANIRAEPGEYRLQLAGEGAVSIADAEPFTVAIKDTGSQKPAQQMVYTLRGDEPGSGDIYLTLEGPAGFQLTRHWQIAVRPAQAVMSEQRALSLAPGRGIRATRALLEDYVASTGQVRLSFSSRPNIDVPGLLATLQRYPYGCVEQLTSAALPLLYFNDLAAAWQVSDSEAEGLSEQVQQAIQRILSLQRYDGAFGSWGANAPADLWLSAYALDFLGRARDKGYLVPAAAYQRGLDRLQQIHVNAPKVSAEQLASYTYALYILARADRAARGDLRYLHDTYLDTLPSSLAQAQLGAALARYGEGKRAESAFAAALLNPPPAKRPGDYGSGLRDRAGVIALLGEADLFAERVPELAQRLAATANQRRYTSTQEQAWLLLAAHALLEEEPGEFALSVNNQIVSTHPYYLVLGPGELEGGVNIANLGKDPVWYVTSRSGVPKDKLPSAQQGFSITRRFYDRTGQPADLQQVRQNDMLVAVISGTATTQESHQSLVVDLLPAGFEIANAQLGASQTTDELPWLPELSQTLYQELRDDRYVAALNLDRGEREFTLAYLLRAVTPGDYHLPAVFVEDMYKPWFFGRDEMSKVRVENLED